MTPNGQLPHTVVLLYHDIGTTKSSSLPLHSVSIENFDQQIDWLDQHYDIIPLDELFSKKLAHEPTDGLAAITFDDGYRSVIEHAVPVLICQEVPATIFLCSEAVDGQPLWRDLVRYIIEADQTEDCIDYLQSELGVSFNADTFYRKTKDPSYVSSKAMHRALLGFLENKTSLNNMSSLYASRDQLQSIQGELITLGNHTANHYVLSSLTYDEQFQEIQNGKEDLEQDDLLSSKVFSVPFGKAPDVNSDTAQICSELGISWIAGTAGQKLTEAFPTTSSNGFQSALFCERVLPMDRPTLHS